MNTKQPFSARHSTPQQRHPWPQQPSLPPPPPGPLEEGHDLRESCWVLWNPLTRGFQIMMGRMRCRPEHERHYQEVSRALVSAMEQAGYRHAPLLTGKCLSVEVVWNLPARQFLLHSTESAALSLAPALRAALAPLFQRFMEAPDAPHSSCG